MIKYLKYSENLSRSINSVFLLYINTDSKHTLLMLLFFSLNRLLWLHCRNHYGATEESHKGD